MISRFSLCCWGMKKTMDPDQRSHKFPCLGKRWPLRRSSSLPVLPDAGAVFRRPDFGQFLDWLRLFLRSPWPNDRFSLWESCGWWLLEACRHPRSGQLFSAARGAVLAGRCPQHVLDIAVSRSAGCRRRKRLRKPIHRGHHIHLRVPGPAVEAAVALLSVAVAGILEAIP